MLQKYYMVIQQIWTNGKKDMDSGKFVAGGCVVRDEIDIVGIDSRYKFVAGGCVVRDESKLIVDTIKNKK